MYTNQTLGKRTLSIVLAVIMILSVFTASGFLTSSAVYGASDFDITRQPANVVTTQGGKAVLSVSATTSGSVDLSYQWYETQEPVNRNSDDIQKIGNNAEFIPASNVGGKAISGATDRLFVAPTENAGVKSYYVVVSDGTENETSVAATVAVKKTTVKSPSDPFKIVLICGGNTCRTAMGKPLAEKIFAERGLNVEVVGAGSDIIPGDPASANAVTVMREDYGIDLSGHVAQQWYPDMLVDADAVLTMSSSHINRLNVPTLNIYSDKVMMMPAFVGESGGVSDPYGQDVATYRACAQQLEGLINKIADKLQAQQALSSVANAELINPLSKQVYSGKAVTPAIKVTMTNPSTGKKEILNEGTDYTLAYENNVKVGEAKVVITGKDSYSGTKAFTFKIMPKKGTVAKISVGKNKMTVQAGKSIDKDGNYQIRYKAAGSKKWTVKTISAKKNSLTVKKLKNGKKYSVQVRAYKKVAGQKYIGAWSATKTSKKVK